MHCEDLLLIEDELRDPTMTHELPKRIFLRRSHCPSTVPFCDFVFHGDDPNDCLQAFLEILGKYHKTQRNRNLVLRRIGFFILEINATLFFAENSNEVASVLLQDSKSSPNT